MYYNLLLINMYCKKHCGFNFPSFAAQNNQLHPIWRMTAYCVWCDRCHCDFSLRFDPSKENLCGAYAFAGSAWCSLGAAFCFPPPSKLCGGNAPRSQSVGCRGNGASTSQRVHRRPAIHDRSARIFSPVKKISGNLISPVKCDIVFRVDVLVQDWAH